MLARGCGLEMIDREKVLVIGGGGYVGSRLVPALLNEGFKVEVYDLFWYGLFLPDHPNLQIVEGDVRDSKLLQQSVDRADSIIHLACISNDPSFELDPSLGKSINYDCFRVLVDLVNQSNVKKFIYASSSSVYGIKSGIVDETRDLEPLTDYSKFKMLCEEFLAERVNADISWTVIRPATVCGYAPRQRLDVIVNIFVTQALDKGVLTVFGGKQLRPNIHVDDMTDAYLAVLFSPAELVSRKTYNVGDKNYSVLELAEMTQRVLAPARNVEIELRPSTDDRSYHVSSELIKHELSFVPRRGIEKAIKDLAIAIESGKLTDPATNPIYSNIKTLQAKGIC